MKSFLKDLLKRKVLLSCITILLLIHCYSNAMAVETSNLAIENKNIDNEQQDPKDKDKISASEPESKVSKEEVEKLKPREEDYGTESPYFSDDINELDEESITTKIYKSTDPSLELIDSYTSLDPSIENDIITQEELFSKKHKLRKPKVLQKTKAYDANNVPVARHSIMPWLILILMIFILGAIFKFILSKKV